MWYLYIYKYILAYWYIHIHKYLCKYAYLAVGFFVPCQELGADVDRRFADLQAASEAESGDAADVLDHGMLWYPPWN